MDILKEQVNRLKKLMQIKEGALEEMPTARLASKADIEKYSVVLVHLWDSLSALKVAVFSRGTNKETGEKKWMLYEPVTFVNYSNIEKPEVLYLQGKGGKEFLNQQGYEFVEKNKTIRKIGTPNLEEDMVINQQDPLRDGHNVSGLEDDLLDEEKTSNTSRINAPLKSKINKSLRRVLAPTYFKSIPLDDIFEVLYEFGIIPLMEDNTHWDGFLLGRDSNTIFTLAYKSTEQEKDGYKFYEPVINAGLSLSWYKMESGKYEVLGYIS